MTVVRLYSRQVSLVRECNRSVVTPFGVVLEVNSAAPPFDASFVLTTAKPGREVVVMAQRLGATVVVLPEAAYFLYSQVHSAGGVVIAVGADHVRSSSLQPQDGALF
ncbi:hypothetical protein [Rhodococcus sp. SORGH_AS_0303]|uniref:hypothetical protein n=1 Tax=Rhodococcus sp. SORGH_AS_0303 TaxID=3041753 RepID=UPI00278530F9|nr:hypothetical protein [Rhodococcus sp. SORGH_AS_0303]MDQ1202832.1 hypothetical protein [Rhodococcus sp. SORGH_AS_0303]